jgi:hypothetical protein
MAICFDNSSDQGGKGVDRHGRECLNPVREGCKNSDRTSDLPAINQIGGA